MASYWNMGTAEVDTLEYAELVNKIVAAEHSAREIAGEARKQEAQLESDLARESAALRKRCYEQADRKLAQVREETAQAERKSVAALDRKLADAMATVETARKKYQDNWVETLFEMIVGGQV